MLNVYINKKSKVKNNISYKKFKEKFKIIKDFTLLLIL